jgi:hypothetical protein
LIEIERRLEANEMNIEHDPRVVALGTLPTPTHHESQDGVSDAMPTLAVRVGFTGAI